MAQSVAVNVPKSVQDEETVSLQAAIEYRNKTMPRKRVDGAYVPYPICSFDNFGEFGVGILLYFRMLLRLKRTFMIAFFLALPQMAISLWLRRIMPTDFFVEKTMLGAIGPSQEETPIPFTDKSVSNRTLSIIIVSFDIAIVAYLLFSIWRMQRAQLKEAEQSESNAVTAADFTVRVKNLPNNLTDRMELYHFFQDRWGKVVDAVVSFNDSDLVDMFINRGKLKHQMAQLKSISDTPDGASQLAKLKDKCELIDKKIEAFKVKFRRRPVDAYISFDSAASRKSCLASYPNTCWSRSCMKRRLRFKGKRILVHPAIEPSNILFHNLKYSGTSRSCRRMLTSFATVVIMLVSLTIIFFASQKQKQMKSNAVVCTGPTPTREDALRGVGIDCYCASLLSRQLVESKDLCQQWAANLALSKLLTALIAVTIFVVNMFLKTMIVILVRFEKHNTLSSQEKAITEKLFVALFINTGIIIMLVNGNLSRFHLGEIFNGSYSDVDSDWYRDVGVSIMLTMTLNVVNPHIMPVIQIPISALKRFCRRKKMKTQKDLNDLYSGPSFVLSDRYAAVLNTMFVSLLYSSGIPLMLFTCSLTLMFTRLFDKIALLRLYRYPPMMDKTLGEYAVSIMKWAVFVHCAMALWTYSYPATLSSDSIDPNTPGSNDDFGKRLTYLNAFIFLVIAAVILGQNVLFKLPKLLCCCRRSSKIAPVEKVDDSMTYLDAVRNGHRIDSYHMHDQLQYQDAFVKTPSLHQLQVEPPASDELAAIRLGAPLTTKQQSANNTAGATEQIITVNCPTCLQISNISASTPNQMYRCPFCGNGFAFST